MANNEPFSTADLLAYHKATGCPVVNSKAVLLSMEPESRSRVFRAALGQPSKSGWLRDPIENDPATRELAGIAARAAVGLGRGHCHRFWFEQKRILAAQGITRFSLPI